MKKITYLLLVTAAIAPFLAFGQAPQVFSSPLGPIQPGSPSDSVKYLQQVLKSDPSIYPQGLITGTYGPLTTSAVKKLQAKYNLPQTGVVDSQTEAILFPINTQITIVAPNGGETWDRAQSHNILWKVLISPTAMQGGAPSAMSQSATGSASSGTGVASPGVITSPSMPSIYPFFPYVSIDLIRDSDPSFVSHIATTNLYQSQYAWQISSSIPNGNDFRVRLTSGANVPCLMGTMQSSVNSRAAIAPYPCPLMSATNSSIAQYENTQTSANTFSITGNITPSPDVIAKLRDLMNQMQNTLQQLLNQLNSMQAILNQLPQ